MNAVIMSAWKCIRSGARWLAAGAGLGAASYAAHAGLAWSHYGRPRRPMIGEGYDVLLDRFIPDYEVVERHQIRVAAPAEVALAAAADVDLEESWIVRAIFRSRELIMGARPDEVARPRAFLALVKALGWGVLAEVRGREIVMGAVTQPWKADVVFRALPPGEFATFREPDHVKIAWTLRADPAGPGRSVVRTETRVVSTDPVARAKFRRYWSLASPGIVLIRRATLGLVKAEAERRAGWAAPLPQAAASVRRT